MPRIKRNALPDDVVWQILRTAIEESNALRDVASKDEKTAVRRTAAAEIYQCASRVARGADCSARRRAEADRRAARSCLGSAAVRTRSKSVGHRWPPVRARVPPRRQRCWLLMGNDDRRGPHPRLAVRGAGAEGHRRVCAAGPHGARQVAVRSRPRAAVAGGEGGGHEGRARRPRRDAVEERRAERYGRRLLRARCVVLSARTDTQGAFTAPAASYRATKRKPRASSSMARAWAAS